MIVPLSPAGASHPHQPGVRLGKCHARRKVIVAEPPAGIVVCWHSAPTVPRASGSLSSAPSRENASQKSKGEFHQRPFGHPRQYVVRAPCEVSAASAKLPNRGSCAGMAVLLITSPSSPSSERNSVKRPSDFFASAAPPLLPSVAPCTGLSIENAIPTLALTLAGLCSR